MIFVESHDGWIPRQNGGQWEIVDRSGWVLATIHYDYRFTSNATNFHRAHMLAKAPETANRLAERDAAVLKALDAAIGALDLVARDGVITTHYLIECLHKAEAARDILRAVGTVHGTAQAVLPT